MKAVKWLQELLFNTNYSIENYSYIWTQSNGSKYFYVIPIIQFTHTVKEFQVLLCITNNSIKHQSFFYTQLHDQTVLLLTIQFSMSFGCTQFKCQTVLFDRLIEPYQVLRLQARVDLGAMAMKGYFAFSKASRLKSYYQIV